MGGQNLGDAFKQPTPETAGDPATSQSREDMMNNINMFSGSLGTFGNLLGGFTQGKAYEGSAKAIDDYYDYKAQVTLSSAKLKEDTIRSKAAKEKGSFVATIGKRGLQMTGSILDAYADRSASLEQEALIARIEGIQGAKAYRYQGAAESYALSQKAGQAKGQGAINSIGSILTTANTAIQIAGAVG
jgi:hypothetical protein